MVKRGLLSLLFMTIYSLLLCFSPVSGTSVEKDLSLTQNQFVILDKFKRRVANRLPHKYMREDIYLIRWLRAKNFNIDHAEQLLYENLRWRKTQKIDTILLEDFSEFRNDYAYSVDGVSKDGKPIFTGDFGDWDIRKAGLAGKMGKLIRYVNMGFEEAVTLVRKFQKENKNVTQFDLFINMDNYNIVQHGCVQCLSYYIAVVDMYENHYPGFADHIILFNTPPVFEAVLRVIRPLMSPITRNSLEVYGQNKAQWSKVLLSIAEKDQLPPEYGGTLIRSE